MVVFLAAVAFAARAGLFAFAAGFGAWAITLLPIFVGGMSS
ncbi:hypothetical protein MAXJ12_13896 [Mesorhizobium alhagi CCNWXJ12-2]|uniref:Uncharacterized protein n=1 Tax=Mesorhizobium alhagi CCNWXJ12-2 TaxID=1107882 RepID=H0HRJ4_9HYPH|nr:hypothetical protein MAXJ12_13896 [Mesorhizobium alhagi CCNWXJ12-2]